MEQSNKLVINNELKFKKLFSVSIIGLVLVTSILVAVSVFLLSNGLKKTTTNICTTNACIKAAHQILENLDTSIDPCEDFHEFSCGSFIKNQRIPEDQSKLDIFDVLRIKLGYSLSDLLNNPISKNSDDIEATIKAKKLYQSCIKIEANERNDFVIEKNLKKIIQTEYGGWSMLDFDSYENLTLIDRFIRLRKIGFKSLIDIQVTSNPKDPLKSILKIKQPNWYFNRQYYTKPEFELAYKDYLFKFVNFLNPSFIRTDKRIDAIFEIENKFSSFQTDENLKRNLTYKNFTIKQLTNQIPNFDWEEFIINGIFQNITNTVNISTDETIILEDFDYLINTCNLLASINQENKTLIENFLIWSAIRKELILALPKKYKEAKLEFDKVYKGAKSNPPKEITCSYIVMDSMDFAVGRMYVLKHFANNSKKAASEIIDNLRKEFILILKEIDWLDDESRALAIDKADLIDSKVGYPDYILNKTTVNELYEKFEISDDFLNNSINILKCEVKTSFQDLRKTKDRNTWISSPAVVNAFYSPYSNQICFPAGILQAPFYDADYPNYLNYGGIGSVIGHEITHGFDDRGRLHDKNGVFHDDDSTSLWTVKTIINYRSKMNGITTQGENIADNGGLKQSFRAYEKWASKNPVEALLPGLNYNQKQLFFINYAQLWCSKYRDQFLLHRLISAQHSPGEFRIIGPTSNLKEFANTFNCKINQKNNPEKKCSVW